MAAALFAGHTATLATATAVAAAAPEGPRAGGIGSIFAKMLVNQEFAQPGALLQTLRWDSTFWLLVLLGFGLVCASIGARRDRVQQFQLLLFLLPLSAIAVYRNAFSYFYVTVVPSAALLAGVVVARLDLALRGRPLLAALLILMVASPLVRSAWRFHLFNSEDQVGAQRQVIAAVHTIFPSPVPYVDRCAMVATFPKVGPFMSTWAIEDYRQRGRPVMVELLTQEKPHFLLQNTNSLDLGRPPGKSRRGDGFLPRDFATLQANFIPHWGPIWVAGKTVEISGADVSVVVDVVIAGRYLLEAAGSVSIDGQVVSPGAILDLHQGVHTLSAPEAGTISLRIASAQPPPTTPPPKARIFVGFDFRTTPKRSH